MATPRIGGLNLSSPTAARTTAIYWNPAALGRLYGTWLYLDGVLRMTTFEAERDPIDPSTGLASSGPNALSFPRVERLFLTPDAFGALVSDLGSDSVVLGVAVYTPYGELQDFGGLVPPGADAPLRYHRVRAEWFNLFVTPVVAVRFHRRFYAGVGLSYVRSIVRLSFYRDRTLRDVYRPTADRYVVEDPAASELFQIDAADNSFGVTLGALFNLPKNVILGITYRTRPLATDRTNIEATGTGSLTRISPDGAPVTVSGRGKLFYDLPDSLALGVRWEPNKTWALDFFFEWQDFRLHQELTFKLSGNTFRTAGLGNWDVNFKRYRGFQDVFRIQVGGTYAPVRQLTIGAAFLFESSAVPSEWVTAGAVDNHKADFLFFVEYAPHPVVRIGFGYAFQAMLPVDVDSGFDPARATRCVETKVDIAWSTDCNEMSAGRAIPTASGRYGVLVHMLGLTLAVHYPPNPPKPK